MSGAPVLLRLAGVVWTGWARRCGLRPPVAAWVLAGLALAATGGSYALGRWMVAGDRLAGLGLGAELLAILVGVALVVSTSVVAIAAQAAGSVLTPGARSLLMLPVSSRALALGFALPGLAMTGLVLLALGPASVLVLETATGYGTAHAVVAVVAASLLGSSLGRVVFGVLRHLLAGSGRFAPLTLTAAISVWVLLVAGSVLAGRSLLAAEVDLERVLPYAPLLWTAVVEWTLHPGPAAAGLLLALATILGAIEWRLLGAAAALGLAAPPVIPVRLRLGLRARFPLFRLELARIVRHRRITAWALSAVVVLAGLCVAAGQVTEAARAGFVQNAMLIACQLSSYVPLLARGMSRRERPYPLLLGFSPGRWWLALQAASSAAVLVLLAPFAVALAVVVGEPALVLTAALLLVFVVVAASIVSAVMVPGSGEGATEFAGALIVFAATAAVGMGAAKLVGADDLLPVAALMALLGVCAAWVPGAVEARRWAATRGVAPRVPLPTLPPSTDGARPLSVRKEATR